MNDASFSEVASIVVQVTVVCWSIAKATQERTFFAVLRLTTLSKNLRSEKGRAVWPPAHYL